MDVAKGLEMVTFSDRRFLRESTAPLVVTIVVSITSVVIWEADYTRQTHVTRERGTRDQREVQTQGEVTLHSIIKSADVYVVSWESSENCCSVVHPM